MTKIKNDDGNKKYITNGTNLTSVLKCKKCNSIISIPLGLNYLPTIINDREMNTKNTR